MGNEEEILFLKWDKFDENVKQSFTEFQEKGYFSDVTLACEDKEVKAHKLILSSCSPFFKGLLLNKHVASNVHPLIFFRGVEAEQLEAVLAFMYQGKVNHHRHHYHHSFLCQGEHQGGGARQLHTAGQGPQDQGTDCSVQQGAKSFPPKSW